MRYYAKSTGGFYDDAIHGGNIPDDAVEITAEDHAALLADQAVGKRIIAGADGRPIAVDQLPPSADELAAAKRRDRNAALIATDCIVQRHRDELDMGGKTTLTADQFSTLLAYRKALRDLPAQAVFPKVDLPTMPL